MHNTLNSKPHGFYSRGQMTTGTIWGIVIGIIILIALILFAVAASNNTPADNTYPSGNNTSINIVPPNNTTYNPSTNTNVNTNTNYNTSPNTTNTTPRNSVNTNLNTNLNSNY